MGKFITIAALFCVSAFTTSAAEIRYYAVSSEVGPSYCSQVWPGSQYFGVRQGMGSYYYVACIKH